MTYSAHETATTHKLPAACACNAPSFLPPVHFRTSTHVTTSDHDDTPQQEEADTSPKAEDLGQDARVPVEIPKRGWWQLLKRVWERWNDELYPVAAAGLAFRAMLTLLPVLLAAVALTGLLAQPGHVESAISSALTFLPQDAQNTIIDNIQRLNTVSDVDHGIGLATALLLAMWSTSNGTLALMGTYRRIYREKETRPFYRTRLAAMGLALMLLVAATIALLLVMLLPHILTLFRFGDLVNTLTQIGRFVLLGALMLTMQGLLGRFACDRRAPKWRWLQVGGLVSIALWLLASWALSWYFAELARTDRLYGALSGLVIFALWLQLSVVALLVGALINAESEHQTAVDSTVGPERPLGERDAFVADHNVHHDDEDDRPPPMNP